MHLLDLALVIWLVVGTIVIKLMLRGVSRNRPSRAVFLLVGLLLASLPLVTLKLELVDYSWISVVAAGIALFWFAILMGRVDNVA